MSKKIPVISVDSAVPFPENEKFKYPWASMEIGDSFVFPTRKRGSVASSATKYGQRTGTKFAIRKISGEESRIWRTK